MFYAPDLFCSCVGKGIFLHTALPGTSCVLTTLAMISVCNLV